MLPFPADNSQSISLQNSFHSPPTPSPLPITSSSSLQPIPQIPKIDEQKINAIEKPKKNELTLSSPSAITRPAISTHLISSEKETQIDFVPKTNLLIPKTNIQKENKQNYELNSPEGLESSKNSKNPKFFAYPNTMPLKSIDKKSISSFTDDNKQISEFKKLKESAKEIIVIIFKYFNRMEIPVDSIDDTINGI